MTKQELKKLIKEAIEKSLNPNNPNVSKQIKHFSEMLISALNNKDTKNINKYLNLLNVVIKDTLNQINKDTPIDSIESIDY